MAGAIKVNTAQVAAIASKMDGLNVQLEDTLKASQKSIQNLRNTWTGEASQATIEAFDSFAAKYFQSYKDMIDAYAKFLRACVEQGYFETESANINLADAFR